LKIYDKRSSFAHGRNDSNNKDKSISLDDFLFVLELLKAAVACLYNLMTRKGITSIEEDANSFDSYLENLKFSSRVDAF
jgi:hypothetical protein